MARKFDAVLNCTKDQRDFFNTFGKPAAEHVEAALVELTQLKREVRFLMSHTVFEPRNPGDKQKIMGGIPQIKKLMGWAE